MDAHLQSRLDEIHATCLRLEKHSRKMLVASTETRVRVDALESRFSRSWKLVTALFLAVFGTMFGVFVKEG